MLEASSHEGDERFAASQLLDNCTMALESLPRRHSSEPDPLITALAAVVATWEASGYGTARFQAGEASTGAAIMVKSGRPAPMIKVFSSVEGIAGVETDELVTGDLNWSFQTR